ncbi:hypothetical protein STFE110948_06715 [Streptobacillus felis]|uniref:Uncharacterized protein n=1 Tax=Streptobacillus felis TaxID=1384509 RepID=A0A7Z0PFP6_9FUSO|nr:hypothetical protein [Streptobacillus felis]NYV28408.1 hypothetical protein [Streptobacillus felis]
MTMEEKNKENVFALLSGLKMAEINNNKVQKEFCAALIYKYQQEGINIYEHVKKEDIEESINEGVNLFVKRKRRYFIKKTLFNMFTGMAAALFTYGYLQVSLARSIVVFFFAFLIDSLIKLKVSKIVFVNEARKEYERYVDHKLVHIRESEDVSKLWK